VNISEYFSSFCRLPRDIPMLHAHEVLVRIDKGRELLGDCDRAMAPAGAANAYVEIRLPLVRVMREQETEESGVEIEKRFRRIRFEHVIRHPLFQASMVAELRNKVRVREKTHVNELITIGWDAALKA